MSQDFDIEVPEKETMRVVSYSDWQRLRKKVESIKTRNSVFQSIGFVLIGVAATALIGVLTLVNSDSNNHVICWAIFAAATFCACCCLIIYYVYERNREKASKTDIEECLDEIDARYIKQ